LEDVTLVAKLRLGNAIGEAPASRCYWKQELPTAVTKLELGNEGNAAQRLCLLL